MAANQRSLPQVLYELHVALLITGRGGVETREGKHQLARSLACLREALDLLQYEPSTSFGGQLFLGGRDTLPRVEQFVTRCAQSS